MKLLLLQSGVGIMFSGFPAREKQQGDAVLCTFNHAKHSFDDGVNTA